MCEYTVPYLVDVTENERAVFCGKIKTEGLVDISDPTYPHMVVGRINAMKVVPGSYDCIAVMGKHKGMYNGEPYDYEMPHAILIVNEDIRDFTTEPICCKDYISFIGVDAGLVSFFASPKPDFMTAELSMFAEAKKKTDYLVVKDKELGYEGFIASTFMDGGFPVFGLKNKEGEFVALKILIVLSDDDEEETDIPDDEEDGYVID